MSKAFKALGLDDTATPKEVKLKWRQLCMIHHPDRGGNAVTFDELRRAYDAAYSEASKSKFCPKCKGSGKILQSRGFSSIMMACMECNGSGYALGEPK